MITVLTGENSFEITRALQQIIATFDGIAEKVDGSELEIRDLPDILMGGTLFANRRLVIIRNLSENKPLWGALTDWLPRISDDIQLVLVDEKFDKRTKTYKDLQKLSTIKDFKVWSERDVVQAEKWVVEEAARLSYQLDAKCARALVVRVGVDQWLLYQALQKLAVIQKVTPEIINNLIDTNPLENVFNLFEAALRSDVMRIRQMIATLQLGEDPYRLFGLISGQAFHLLALALTDKAESEVAKELGVHPFALGKLVPYSKTKGKIGAKKIVTIFIEADGAIKTSAADPWLLIERALIKVAYL